MKGYTIEAEEIKEYRIVSLKTGKAVAITHTEESAVLEYNNLTNDGLRVEIQKVIRLIVRVDE